MWNVEEDEVQLAAVGVFLPLFKIEEKLKKIEKDGNVWNVEEDEVQLGAVGVFLPLFKMKEKFRKMERC